MSETDWNGPDAGDGCMDAAQRNPGPDGYNAGVLADADDFDVKLAMGELDDPPEDGDGTADLTSTATLEDVYAEMRTDVLDQANERKQEAAWAREDDPNIGPEADLPLAKDLDDACAQLAAARGLRIDRPLD